MKVLGKYPDFVRWKKEQENFDEIIRLIPELDQGQRKLFRDAAKKALREKWIPALKHARSKKWRNVLKEKDCTLCKVESLLIKKHNKGKDQNHDLDFLPGDEFCFFCPISRMGYCCTGETHVYHLASTVFVSNRGDFWITQKEVIRYVSRMVKILQAIAGNSRSPRFKDREDFREVAFYNKRFDHEITKEYKEREQGRNRK